MPSVVSASPALSAFKAHEFVAVTQIKGDQYLKIRVQRNAHQRGAFPAGHQGGGGRNHRDTDPFLIIIGKIPLMPGQETRNSSLGRKSRADIDITIVAQVLGQVGIDGLHPVTVAPGDSADGQGVDHIAKLMLTRRRWDQGQIGLTIDQRGESQKDGADHGKTLNTRRQIDVARRAWTWASHVLSPQRNPAQSFPLDPPGTFAQNVCTVP